MRAKIATTVSVALALWAGNAGAANNAPHDVATHNITCNSCHIAFGGVADGAHTIGLPATPVAATAGTTTSVTLGTATWVPGAWVGAVVTFSSAPNLGVYRIVTSNTATTLNWDSNQALGTAPSAGDTFWVNLVAYDDIEIKCKFCHTAGGQASAHPDGALHFTNKGAIGCGKCHEPHAIDANSGWSGGSPAGANLMRTSIRRPDGSKGTIVYSPGVLFQAAGDGLCQTCHTQTSVFQRGATPPASVDHHDYANTTTNPQGCQTAGCHNHNLNFNSAPQVAHGHMDSTAPAYNSGEGANLSCARCHSDLGFRDYIGASDGIDNHLTGTFTTNAAGEGNPSQQKCTTCHNAAGDALNSVLFPSLQRIDNLDHTTALCSQCHQGRESTPSVNAKITLAVTSKGIGQYSTSAQVAGTTTTVVRNTSWPAPAPVADQFKGYTLLFTGGVNKDVKVTVTGNTATTITFTPAVANATAIGDGFTLWPTATGGGTDTYDLLGASQTQTVGMPVGGAAVVRGTDLVDANRAWTADQWKGFYLFVQTGPNAGLFRQIVSNTATRLVVSTDSLTCENPIGTQVTCLASTGVTATGGTTTSVALAAPAQPWSVNLWVGGQIMCTKGANLGAIRTITANTTTSVTWADALPNTVAATDTFVISMYPAGFAGMPFPVPNTAGSYYQILPKQETSVLDTVVTANMSFSNIHYLGASAVLHGSDAFMGNQNPMNYADGTPKVAATKNYAPKNLHAITQDSCKSCHNQHTLEVVVSANTCGKCHFKEDGTPVTTFAELEEARQFGFEGDIDGDNSQASTLTAESLKAEVDGLAALLLTAIQNYAALHGGAICYTAASNPYWFKDTNANGACDAPGETASGNAYGAGTGAFTPRLLRAAFNYQMYVKEPGAWAHNPRYIIGLLYDSAYDLNTTLPIAKQVGFACITGSRTMTANGTTQVPTDADGTCTLAGGARTLVMHRSFAYASHFDGAKGAFRRWDGANTGNTPFAGQTQYPCERCHGGQGGYQQFLTTATFFDQTQPSAAGVTPSQGMQCYLCHQPAAGDTDMKTLRNLDASPVAGVRFPGHWAGGTLGSPATTTTVLTSASFAARGDMLCISCHGGRDMNGKGIDLYLAGVWSGIDVVGLPFYGSTSSLADDGVGHLRLTGLPHSSTYTRAGVPNNWLWNPYATSTATNPTSAGAPVCAAINKYITITGSATPAYNGTFKVTACNEGYADFIGVTGVPLGYADSNNGSIAWASWASAAKNNHDLPAGQVFVGGAGHQGYEYVGQSYFGVKQHHGGPASCIECHSPQGSRHSFEVAEAAAAGKCSGGSCHGAAVDYTNWVALSRTLHTCTVNGTSPYFTCVAGGTTLDAELTNYANLLGAAANAYQRGKSFAPALAANICVKAGNSTFQQVAANVSGVCTGASANWAGGYDAKLNRAGWNLNTVWTNVTGTWAHNLDYTAQLLYDSAYDLDPATVTASGLPRPGLTPPHN